jgi:hypothetical protein
MPLGLNPGSRGGGGYGIDMFPVILGATQSAVFDATITDHTGTDPCVWLKLDVAANNVKGYGVDMTLMGDYGTSVCYRAVITGPAAGGATGKAQIAYSALLVGDNNDVDITYSAFSAAFIDSGGAGVGTFANIGLGFDHAIYSFSGNLSFFGYSPIIQVTNAVAGNGQSITLNAADATGAGPSLGGDINVNPGDGVGGGPRGKIHMCNDLQGGGYWHVVISYDSVNAGPFEVFNIPVLDNEVWSVEIVVVGQKAGTEACRFHKSAVFYRLGAALAQLGATAVLASDTSKGGYDANMTADAVNNTIDITVTGAAGDGIKWKVLVKAMKVVRDV